MVKSRAPSGAFSFNKIIALSLILVYSKNMKSILKIFIPMLFLVLWGTGFVLAENAKTPEASDIIKLKIADKEIILSQTETEKWMKKKNELVYSPKYNSEIENTDICQYEKSLNCNLIFNSQKELCVKKIYKASVDENAVKQFIEETAKKIDREPENAKMKMEEGKASVFSLGAKGVKLNQEKSLEILLSFLKNNERFDGRTLELPYGESSPEVSIDSIDNMGIKELIGEGRSNFRGSPKNRIFNIKVATEKFNGVLIKPGEDFSFVKVLGEVDGEHGYLPELVIKKDKTEPEFGGGICQVSTTAFRAAINSGLKITARRNHAYPVSYYNPQGMDATVYVPRPDLRFTNDTPGYILIQTKIEGTELVFDFYGTSDGRKVNVIGPKITERKPDGGMKTAFTQQILDAAGNIIREEIFKSDYDSPNKYPHPGQTVKLTSKPNGWSDNEWEKYKKENGL